MFAGIANQGLAVFFFLKINLNYALETMHWLSLAGCTNWVIRLQTGVEWLFLARFKVSKEPKGPDMSSFIVRGPQNCLSSHKKIFLGGINSVYKAVGSFIDCTSCTCQASTKYKLLTVVYSGWVGQSEFPKAESDCCQGLEVADTQIDNSLCVGSPHWDTIGSQNKYVWIRLQTGVELLFLLRFEFCNDQKRFQKVKNVFFYCQRFSKLPQQSQKIICFG